MLDYVIRELAKISVPKLVHWKKDVVAVETLGMLRSCPIAGMAYIKQMC
jgi:hypothetical protein